MKNKIDNGVITYDGQKVAYIYISGIRPVHEVIINDKKNYVTLAYMAHDADKRLDAMKKALADEAKAAEDEARRNNKDNNKGL